MSSGFVLFGFCFVFLFSFFCTCIYRSCLRCFGGLNVCVQRTLSFVFSCLIREVGVQGTYSNQDKSDSSYNALMRK